MKNYRADIDGLRAVAILPVILFHAEFPLFSGGYIGVDVFFVISGYLITSIIMREISNGSFSIATFYERRIRRIFPALFAVLGASYFTAWFMFMPAEFEDFGKSLLGATFFSSNFIFFNHAGYFDGPATLKPLLHTWSLAVEEQFYIFFPPLMILAARFGKKVIWHSIALIAVVSFGLSIWAASNTPAAGFYLLHSRAWELMLGSLLAVGVLPATNSRAARNLLGALGMAMIGYAVVTFDETTIFPGLNAVFPSLGAGLLIYSGRKIPDTFTAKLLSLKPLVWTGLISYSLYLWHWPLLVFAEYYKIDSLTHAESGILLVISIGISWFSWRFIEQPFRGKGSVFTRRRLFRLAGVTMAAALALGLLAGQSDGLAWRLDDEVARVAAFTDSRNPGNRKCFANENKWIEPKNACVIGASDQEPRMALWGDSHANAAAEGIALTAEKHGMALKLFGYGGCPPVIGLRRIDTGPEHKCPQYTRQVLEYLRSKPRIKTVILLWRQSVYIDGFNTDFGPAEGGTPPLVTPVDTKINGTKISRAKAYADKIAQTVAALLEADKKVILVYPIPETGYEIPSTLARIIARGRNPADFTRPHSYYRTRHDFVIKTLNGLGKHKNLYRIYPDELLCKDGKCLTWHNNAPLYHDDDHLSRPGGIYFAQLFAPLFKSMQR